VCVCVFMWGDRVNMRRSCVCVCAGVVSVSVRQTCGKLAALRIAFVAVVALNCVAYRPIRYVYTHLYVWQCVNECLDNSEGGLILGSVDGFWRKILPRNSVDRLYACVSQREDVCERKCECVCVCVCVCVCLCLCRCVCV